MPYNPGVQFDPSLITRSGDALSGAIVGIADNFAQLKKEDKAAKALYDALQPEADAMTGEQKGHPLGINKEQFATMSSKERVAKVGGFVKAQALKSAMAEQQQRAKEFQLREKEVAAAVAESEGNEELNRMALTNSTNPALRNAITNMPKILKSNPQLLLRALEAGNEGATPNLAFQEDPVSGVRFATFGKSISPSGVNPEQLSEAVDVTDSQGNVLGKGLRTRSGIQMLKTGEVTERDQFKALTDEKRALIAAKSRAVLPQLAAPYDTAIAAIDEELKKLQQPSGKSAKTATAENTGVINYILKDGKLVAE
jgi:hypothetical protein